MYKLRNITKGKVIIKDLGIIFSSNEEKDLDNLFPRSVILNSTHLKAAIGKYLSEPYDDSIIEIEYSQSQNIDLSEIEKRLKEHITQHLSAQKTESPDISNKLDKLFEMMSQNKPNTEQFDEADYAVNDDKLLDIHVKSVKRLTENTESHVVSKDSTVESDVCKRADELDDIV